MLRQRLDEIHEWVDRWPTPRVPATLLALTFVFAVALLFRDAFLQRHLQDLERVQLASEQCINERQGCWLPDASGPDGSLWYSANELTTWFKLLGTQVVLPSYAEKADSGGGDGLQQLVELRAGGWNRRTLYGVLQLLVGIPFAVTYSGLLLFWLIVGSGDAMKAYPGLRRSILIPISAGCADVLENVFTGWMALFLEASLPSALVVAAAVSTAAKWVLLVLSGLSILVTCRGRVAATIHHLVLVRVSLIIGALLLWMPYLGIVGPPAARSVVSELSGFGLFFAGFLPVLAAAILVHTGTLIWERAPERFHAQRLRVPRAGWRRIRWQMGLVAVFSLPLTWLVLRRSPPDASMAPGLVGALVGWMTVGLVVWAHNGTHGLITNWLIGVARRLRGRMERVLGRQIPPPKKNLLGPGYSSSGDQRVVPGPAPLGHLFSAFLAFVLLAVYLLIGWSSRPGGWLEVPALVFVLLVLMLAASVLSGLTFFFDRVRLPVLLVLAAWVVFWQSFFPGTHTVLLTESARVAMVEDVAGAQIGEAERSLPQPVAASTPTEALAARLDALGTSEGSPRVLTVVTATGGGIQAAAWTAQVLQGLAGHPDFGAQFIRSVHLLSGVSGGAVGIYYFAEAFDLGQGLPHPQALAAVPEKAMASSLSATTWGIAYPDLQRTFLPWLVLLRGQHRDRGWAMERVWAENAAELRNLAGDDRRTSSLQDWALATSVGKLPAIVLGSTFVDDGRQALFANVDLSRLGCGLAFEERYSRTADPGLRQHFAPVGVGEHGSQPVQSCDEELTSFVPNIDAASAARLSATFPWVTPVARIDFGAENGNPLSSYHLADGGYFDNFGTFVAIQWLRHLARQAALDDFDKVLILEINGFPLGTGFGEPEGSGLGYSLVGPLKTLLAVRTSSQESRMVVELDLLHQQLSAGRATDDPGGDEPGRNRLPEFEVLDVRIPRSAVSPPPLSWRMSTLEQKEILLMWDQWERNNSNALASVLLENPLVHEAAETVARRGVGQKVAHEL